MCNAARHSPGCMCGFGPPYPSYTTSDVTEWAEEAIRDPKLASRGLAESAWDRHSIEAFLEAYWGIRNSGLPHHGMVARIKELLGMRRTIVESVSDDWIDVPLYQ